jgi:hypothetical protein
MSNSQALIRDELPDTLEEPVEPKTSATTTDGSREWSGDHGINIRLTIPLIVTKYYLTIVAGKERRGPERQAEERKKHPIWTIGNTVFLAILGVYIWFYLEMVDKLFMAFANKF